MAFFTFNDLTMRSYVCITSHTIRARLPVLWLFRAVTEECFNKTRKTFPKQVSVTVPEVGREINAKPKAKCSGNGAVDDKGHCFDR